MSSGPFKQRSKPSAASFPNAMRSKLTKRIIIFQGIDLVTSGDNVVVTISNLDDYLNLTLDFALESGIRKQMEAFRSGFNQVFPMEKLCSFTPSEVRTMLCGDQCPVFTR